MKRLPLGIVVPAVCAVVSGAVLFWTAQSVQQNEHELTMLENGIKAETEALRVLETEWDYLNAPHRIEKLAKQHLQMEPAKAARLQAKNALPPMPATPKTPLRKPLRDEAVAAALNETRPDHLPSEDTPPSVHNEIIATPAMATVKPGHKPQITPAVSGTSPRDKFDKLLHNLSDGGAE